MKLVEQMLNIYFTFVEIKTELLGSVFLSKKNCNKKNEKQKTFRVLCEQDKTKQTKLIYKIRKKYGFKREKTTEVI